LMGPLTPQRFKVEFTERRFSTLTGDYFFYRAWRSSSPQAVAMVLHDLGESSDNYMPLGEYLALNGITTYAVDLRGHGDSCGERGHVDSFERLVRDVELFSNLVRSKENKTPYLIAQGISSVIALAYAVKGDLAGLVLSTPIIKLRGVEEFTRGFKASLLSFVVAKRKVSLKLENEIRISIKMVRELVKAMSKVYDYARKISSPVMIIVDLKNSPVMNEELNKFLENIASPEKSLLNVEGGYYLLRRSEKAAKLVVEWILEQSSKSKQ